MTKSPLARSLATILCLVAAPLQGVFAGPNDSYETTTRRTTTTYSSIEQRELARRADYVARGRAALEAAEKAMDDKDYEMAVSQYKLACDLIPNSRETRGLYAEAIHGFCKASCRFAEQRIAEGRYADAEIQLKLVLDERYHPGCREAVVILSHLETPGYYNQTIGPRFRGTVEETKKLLLEAQGFFDTGRFDLAAKRCDQVLNLDRYNKAARRMQEKINLERDHYANVAYQETRSRLMWKLDQAWEMPIRKFGLTTDTSIPTGKQAESGTARINAKLQNIIIPKLEFREATIREAVEFLKRKSIELDTRETDPALKGVNIVLKLEGGGPMAPAPAPAAEAPAIPGLEPLPGMAPPAPDAAPAMAPANADARITVSLTNIPLIEALRYVTSLANLKFKVEAFAVTVVPQNVDTTVLITREWKVRPGFIIRTAGGGGDTSSLAPAPPADASKGGSGIVGRQNAKEFLQSVGVSFPGDSSATYIAAGSRLIVRNTAENLDLVDTLVQVDAEGGGITQVEIEAKFVEITQSNLKELSFDIQLGQANVPGSPSSIFIGGGTPGTSPGANPQDFGFVAPGGQIVGGAPLTAGNRSGQLGISANAVDALLFGTTGATQLAPGILSLAGVFTDPTFQVVARALNQKKGVDLLSAPKVTTKSGQRAVIEIIREFRYPTEFDPPQIPQNFGAQGGGGGFAIVGGGGGLNPFQGQNEGSFPVTPTTPTSFETRNTGVTLEVEPVVGPDGYTIDLNLVPQVVEFEGFINYGSPIQTTSTNALGQSVTNVITPNVINQPIFSTRKVTTSVSVFDGQTVVLGGLMREDVQKVEDKVPFFGDIPIIGRLFRSNIDQHLKRNLVIFVSARLINPAGEPVRSEEEVEEVIELAPPTEQVVTTEAPFMPK